MPAPDYAQTIQPFTFPQISAQAPSYENIMKLLSTPTATESQFMPEIAGILGQQSQFLQPALAGLQAGRAAGSANLQGAFARRGLTGGSIEAQALAQHEVGTQAQMSEMLGNFAMQNSQMFAQLLARARAGDVQAQRSFMQLLAQAMGDELTANRDMEQFRLALQEGHAAEGRERNAARQAIPFDIVKALGPALIGLATRKPT